MEILFVKTVIHGKAFQIFAFIASQIGGVQQFVVEVTDGSVMPPDTQVNFVDGIVTLLVIHHEQVVFQNGFQDGVDQLPAVIQYQNQRIER